MKAVRLHGKEDLRVEEVARPRLAAGELLLRVKAAFICGTDLRMYAHGRTSGAGPLTLGHEVSGIVEEVGDQAPFRAGQRVAVAPNMGCGVCDTCVGGNTQLCAQLTAIGVNVDGGFAELLRVPVAAVRQGNVALLPEGVGFGEAALAEPFSCVYNAFERLRTQPGETVLVIGAGPIGLMHAKLHKAAGAGLVMIHDINEQRLAACREEDASFATIGPERVREELSELTGGQGANIIITAAPSPAAQALSFELAAVNGRIMFFGGLPKDREQVSLNTNIIHYRQISVTGTTRQNLRQYRTCLNLIARREVDLSRIITHTFSLDEALEAFATVRAGKGLKSGFVL